MWGTSPLGKLQVLPQLSRGVDVTQRVLGVDEDEAFDLHTLKPPGGRIPSAPPEGQSHRDPRGRPPGKCDGTVFTTQQEANEGRELHLQHRVSYERKYAENTA